MRFAHKIPTDGAHQHSPIQQATLDRTFDEDNAILLLLECVLVADIIVVGKKFSCLDWIEIAHPSCSQYLEIAYQVECKFGLESQPRSPQ